MSYRDDDDPFEEDIVFDQAGLLSASRKSSKSAIRRVSSGKCATFSKTLGLCGAFLGLGLTFAIPGPLSPVPPSELSHDITLMTYEVMYRCQGFMIGAMFGSRLLDRFNRLFLVFLALLVTALLVTIVPWCGIVWLLRTDMFLLGVSFGFLMTGGNVLCLDLWGRNSGPFMQALHFSFSLGVFLAPFLSQPLMAPVNYQPPVPSTTPAIFPVHRLVRDVGNVSFAGTSSLSTVGTPLSQIFDSKSVNHSWTSTTPASFNLSSTKEQSSIHGQAANQNSSRDSALLDKVLSSSPHINSTVQSPTSVGPPFHKVFNASSSKALSESVASSTPLLVSSTSSTNSSDTSQAPKLDVSTTTHRAPRPKPVLTNSEKLQDKKWENESFRNPPPEDLVPVATTMKPKAKTNNTTKPANIPSISNSSSVSQVRNTTMESNSSLNLLKNISAAHILPNNNTATNKTPLSSSTMSPQNITSTTSVSNTSSLNHILESTSSSLQTPSSILMSSQVLVTPSSMAVYKADSSTITGNNSSPAGRGSNHTKTAGTFLKNSNDSLLASNANAKVNPEEQPKSAPPESVANTAVSTPPMSMGSAGGVVNGSRTKSSVNIQKKEWMQETSHSKEGDSNQNSFELSLPLYSKSNTVNDSHTMGKSISLDAEELSVASSTSDVGLKFKDTKILKSTIESTTQSSKNTKLDQYAKTSLPSQGQPTVKTKDEEKLLPNQSPKIKNAEVSTTERSTGIVGKVNTPLVHLPSSSVDNSSQKLDSPGIIGTPVSPKHTHHSKPASTVVNDTEVTHTVIDAFANRLEKYGLSRMELMYLTVGMVLLATSFLFLGFLCFNPRDPKSKTDDEEMNGHVRGSQRSRMTSSGQLSVIPSRCLRHTLIALMMLLLMITSGVQAMYGQLLLVYAIQSPLQIPQSTGTALTATFWGALTSSRFACILLASALSPTAMLILSVSICSCATWLLSAFASSSEVALWIGSVMVSVGTASVFPSGMLWMQRHVLITHKVAAMLVMGPAMGEMFLPTLAYKMMVSLGPASLVHLPALLSLLAIALWAAVWRLARYPRQPLCSQVDESSGYQLANQHDEDDLLDLTMSPIVNGNGNISRNSVRSNSSNHRLHQIST